MTSSRGPRTTTEHLGNAVLGVFAATEELTRAQIEQRTGFSRTVVTALVESLLRQGALSIAGPAPRAPGRPGRPPVAYRLASLQTVALVHLERHGIVVRLVTADGCTDERIVDEQWTGPWDRWTSAVERALAVVEIDPARRARYVVLVVPFPVGKTQADLAPALSSSARADPTGRFSDLIQTLAEWRCNDPRRRLSRLLGRPVAMVNDANLAALGEAVHGAGSGHGSVVHLRIRDGIGAGLVLNGRLVTGAAGSTGELAHAQVTEDGPACICGSRGCLATAVPQLARRHTLRYAQPGSLLPADFDRLTEQGDPVIFDFFHDLGRLVARPVAQMLTVLNPDILIVERALGVARDPFILGLGSEVAARCPPAQMKSVQIIPGRLENPSAYGALALSGRAGADVTFVSTDD